MVQKKERNPIPFIYRNLEEEHQRQEEEEKMWMS